MVTVHISLSKRTALTDVPYHIALPYHMILSVHNVHILVIVKLELYLYKSNVLKRISLIHSFLISKSTFYTVKSTSPTSDCHENSFVLTIVIVIVLIIAFLAFHQLLGRTEGSIHRISVVEERKVNIISFQILVIADHVLESVSPQHFSGQIAGPLLDALSSGLDRPFEHRHNFVVILQNFLRAHIEERRIFVDFVDDRRGPNENYIAPAALGAHVEFSHVLLEHFTLFRFPAFYHEALHPGLRERRVPQVSNPEHETQLPVPLGDDGVLGEQQSVGPLPRPDHLRPDHGPHVPVDDHRDHALEGHQEHALGALLRDHTITVPDCRLRFDTVQETRGEIVDPVDAGSPVDVVLVGRQVVLLEIAVDEEDEPPDDGEQEPAEHVGAAEGEQGPSPLGVHEEVEGVDETDDYGTVLGDDVVLAVLEDDAAADVAEGARLVGPGERRFEGVR